MSGDREGQSFEERLGKARASAGLDRPPPEGKPVSAADSGAIRIAMRLGVEIVAALVIAVVIGWGLDRLFHTRPWLMIAFVPLGAAAGLRNVFRAVGPGSKS
ncbi:MAG: AtpZ/AtpI family protein [Proteobacteria bacterium]|nr:AtpZ/AtpI family protein [Pseudomonadota bacterium]